MFLGVDSTTSHGYLMGVKIGGEWKIDVSSSFVVDGKAVEMNEPRPEPEVLIEEESGAVSSPSDVPLPASPTDTVSAPATPIAPRLPRTPVPDEPIDEETPDVFEPPPTAFFFFLPSPSWMTPLPAGN